MKSTYDGTDMGQRIEMFIIRDSDIPLLMLFSYSISTSVLESPDRLLSYYSMISLALHITAQHTNNKPNPYIYQISTQIILNLIFVFGFCFCFL